MTIDILSQRNLTDVSFVRQCNFPTHAQKRQILVQGSLTYYLGKKSALVGGLRDTKRIWGGEGGLWVALEIPNGYGCFLRRGWTNLKLKWVSLMGLDGWDGWDGWDGNQKCPLNLFISRYIRHYTHIYLYIIYKKNVPPNFLWV